MSYMMDVALRFYASHGLAVFPCKAKKPLCKNGLKDATTNKEQIREWWTRWPKAQVGLPTGVCNHLIVVDIDGPSGSEWIKKQNWPHTLTVETSPHRFQLYFKQPDGIATKNSAGKIAPEIDIRGDGGYCIGAFSFHHKTGKPYLIVRDISGVKETENPLLPWADTPTSLLALVTVNGAKPPVSGDADAIQQGKRHHTMLSLAGSFRARGFSPETVIANLRIVNEHQCKPPLPDAELQKMAQYVGTKPAGPRGSGPISVETCVSLKAYSMIGKEHLEYLWRNYLPLGKLTHFVGNSGEGKSPVCIDLIARCTTGRDWPDGSKNTLGPREVILLAAEDDPRDTIRPRLDLAGADVSRVHHVVCTVKTDQGESEKLLALSSDLGKLIDAARALPDLAFVVIDPISNYLGGGVKMNAEEEVRPVLMPLVLVAADLGICVLTIGHLNRRERGTDPLDRIMGARAFSGVARFIFFAGPDPDDTDPHAHCLVQRRGVDAPALRYRTFMQEQTWAGKTSGVIGVEWRGTSNATAEDAVDPQKASEKSEEREAAKMIKEILGAEGRQPVKEMHKRLAEAGVSIEKLNTTRLLKLAGAGSMRWQAEKFYSWFLKTTAG